MDNEKFESFTRSISGVSKYSDAYEDFDEEIGTSAAFKDAQNQE